MRTRPAMWMAFRGNVISPVRMAAAVLLSLLSAATLWAQETEGGGGTIVPVTRSWIIEAVIVGVMVALALFVICRASRRQ